MIPFRPRRQVKLPSPKLDGRKPPASDDLNRRPPADGKTDEFTRHLEYLEMKYPSSRPPRKDPITYAHWLGYRLGQRNVSRMLENLSSEQMLEFMRAYRVGFEIWKKEHPFGW